MNIPLEEIGEFYISVNTEDPKQGVIGVQMNQYSGHGQEEFLLHKSRALEYAAELKQKYEKVHLVYEFVECV